MPKKVKKKIRFKLIPIFVFLLSLVILYFAITYISDTKIRNIYVYNNNILSDQEIIDLAGISDYPSFYKTLSKSIKNSIKKNPIVKDVKVKKRLFNVLKIYIEEETPVFIQDNMIVLSSGAKVDLFACKIPILSGLNEGDIYKKLISSLSKIDKKALRQMSQIIYSPSEYDKTRFLIYMDDGNHVYININKLENINYYDEIYPTLNGKKGTLYLDSGNHFETF